MGRSGSTASSRKRALTTRSAVLRTSISGDAPARAISGVSHSTM